MNVLAVTIVGLPFLASVLVAIALRRAPPVTAHGVALATAGLAVLFALVLLPLAGDEPVVAIAWLPDAGLMGLTLGASGLYVALVTAGAAFLVILGTASRSAESTPLAWAVLLLALGAAGVAFLTDHFLARYVALEVVALCVALAPMVEVRGPDGIRLARSGYLLLRVGDAGLLAAILILGEAGGALHIAPALAAGETLDGARLGWVVGGLVLAVWVKLGGWPFHLWSQAGRRLSPASQAWLYATLVPNLGAYLLYRTAPLLALDGSLQTAALWLGAGGAALAGLIALTQTDSRVALVYVGAAQGGLALFAAAAGVKTAVWLGILALTPVRLLLFLAADAARNAGSAARRGVSVGLFGLGGLALVAFNLLTTWWAREAGVPLDTLFVAQAAVALIAIWAVRAVWWFLRPSHRAGEGTTVHWTQWTAVGLLGGGVLAGGLAFEPLVRHMVAAGHVTLPALPALLHYVATAPALLAVLVLSLAAWQLQRRSGRRPLAVVESTGETYDLGEGLARAAEALRAVVEVGIAERIVALVVRAVVVGARAAWAVEHGGLESLTSRVARAVGAGARAAHRVVEQEGLEGLVRYSVRIALRLSRILQRWHTGRLRRNLLWVPITLALAVLALVVVGW